MGSEMRSGFNTEWAVSNGLQFGREQQLLLLQQLQEEKIGFFELYNDPLCITHSSAPSSSSDSDSAMNGNHISSSSKITNGYSPAESVCNGLELRMKQQQLQPNLIHESNHLHDGPHATSPNFSSITTEFYPDNFFLGQNVSNSFKLGGQQLIVDQNSFVESPSMSSGTAVLMPSISISNGNLTPESIPESNSPEDLEILSDMVLNYINQMLMEEDIDGKFDVYPEHPALLAAEKPFYDILEEKILASETPLRSRSYEESLEDGAGYYSESFNRTGDATMVQGKSQPSDNIEHHQLQTTTDSLGYSSASPVAYKNSAGIVMQGMDDNLSGFFSASESFPAWHFQKGLEEARKFLPSDDKLVISLESVGFSAPREPKGGNSVQVKTENEDRKHVIHQSRGKKNYHDADLDVQEGRSSKQSATSTEEIVRTKLFDEILLAKGENCVVDISHNDSSKSYVAHSKGPSGSKGRGKRQQNKEVADLRTMLIHCAQCVAIDDHRSAYELLKQIRNHADPDGDANQRLAHYFANGLEARLAGTGSEIYHSLIPKQIPITDVLKAYALYMSACPFKRISYYFSNQTILDAAKNAKRLHIIDFGIYYGFQWPCFMQRLSNCLGGPPKLRITAIDTPVSGFRPTELIDETGRRLADYAQSFNIPFEYHAIATSWETIREEDLKIDKDEVLVVNCLFRMKGVADETVLVDSPRDMVLSMIRKLNPAVFIHGIVNGSYNAPFFVTRFREALFHFSALYDVIETNTSRDDESRKLIEKVIYGRDALNVISCEGAERVERPETYKQWQVRNIRAGFLQLPLNPVIVKKARDKYKACYHKDFIIDEDNQWLLQGWKGRIIMALSTWKSNISS